MIGLGDSMPPSSFIQQLERPHFFTGRLLTAADLQDDQDYFRAKSRLHNRLLHGWGVVTGLEVSESAGMLTISAGLALDCAGNELVLAEAKHIALCNVAAKQYVRDSIRGGPVSAAAIRHRGHSVLEYSRGRARRNCERRSNERPRRQRSHRRLWCRPSAVLGRDPSVRLDVADQH